MYDKALRSAAAAPYACSGKTNKKWKYYVKRTVRSVIGCTVHLGTYVGANWRLENAKSPAAVLQGNSPDATYMHMNTPRISLVSCCTGDVYKDTVAVATTSDS